ncbi:MAG: TolC family protein [Candidatus Syntrophonatronum acetioxidans]|uniref:TolC family protein n=1 Tax=Candidatus Syntrophonatronum acetioxidans TaxID=1795816 RepID=A0A424Y981_9FIRM|nr:MAG: TolC family protein [Candidatus Syntrophonatronum acetioxidans]
MIKVRGIRRLNPYILPREGDKKLMMRKLAIPLLLLLLLVIISGAGVLRAEDADNNKEAEPPYSLEMVTELVLTDNQALERAEINVERAQVDMRRARLEADRLKDMDREDKKLIGSSYEVSVMEEIVPIQKEGEVHVKEAEKDQVEREERLTALEKFFSLQKAREQVGVAQKNNERVKEELERAKKLHEIGMATRIDELAMETALSEAESRVQGAESSLKIARMDLLKAMGMEMGREVEGDLILPREPEIDDVRDLEADIKRALETNPGIIQLQEALDISERIEDKARRFYPPHVFIYREATLDRRDMEIALDQSREELEFALRLSNEGIEGNIQKITALEKARELSQENLSRAGVQFELGMVTSLEVLQALEELREMEFMLSEARCDLLLALEEYQVAAGRTFELEVEEENGDVENDEDEETNNNEG